MANPAVKAVLSFLLEAVKRDGENRYRLTQEWTINLTEEQPFYEDELFLIDGYVLKVKPYGGDVCDGVSLAPDVIGRLKAIIGALFHDPWYTVMEKIAVAWDRPVKEVRQLGDRIFGDILMVLIEEASDMGKVEGFLYRRIAIGFYVIVKRAGGVYRAVRKLL